MKRRASTHCAQHPLPPSALMERLGCSASLLCTCVGSLHSGREGRLLCGALPSPVQTVPWWPLGPGQDSARDQESRGGHSEAPLSQADRGWLWSDPPIVLPGGPCPRLTLGGEQRSPSWVTIRNTSLLCAWPVAGRGPAASLQAGSWKEPSTHCCSGRDSPHTGRARPRPGQRKLGRVQALPAGHPGGLRGGGF